MADVVINKLSKSFGSTNVLDQCELNVADRELLVLLGPSGSGKTTLLRMIAGLESPDSGQIMIAGRAVLSRSPQQRNVSMVFQDFALYPHMTVRANIAFPLKARRLSRATIDSQVQGIAHRLELGELLDRLPDQLSGGQQQRLAVARAVVRNSDLLLMDEPLSNIDSRLRDTMRIELRRLQKEFGLTIIYVTHDQTEAMLLGDRIGVVHQGVIEQVGSPQEIYQHPATRFVAEFVGSPPMNFISIDPTIDLGIRPEDLSLEQTSDDDLVLSGTVQWVADLGSHKIVHVRCERATVVLTTHRLTTFQVDQSITVYAAARSLHRFDSRNGRRL